MPCGKQLGDKIELALALVGITKERVTRWLGRPCRCEERKQMLNRLSSWATRIHHGNTDKAEEYLDQILDS